MVPESPCLSSRIKTLFVTHGPLLYGAQQSLLAFLARLDRRVIDPILVSPREGPLTTEARRLGIPVAIAPMQHWVSFDAAAKQTYLKRLMGFFFGLPRRVTVISNLIEGFEADLVYTNTVTVLEGALAARRTRKPHVWHLREHVKNNADLKALLPAGLISLIVGRLSTMIVFNSRALRESYGPSIPDERTSVVHNGIEMDRFNTESDLRDLLRRELGVPAGARAVGIVGSITPRKGLSTFIDAAAKLSRQMPGLCYVVVGDGEASYVESLKARVREADLEKAFRFAGWRDDVDRVFPALDLLLVTAEQEAFGRTIIEAMAARVPVVATRCGGPQEIIEEGVTGFLVPVGDANAVAHAAGRILIDETLSKRLADAAYQRVLKCFSMTAYVNGLQSAILAARA